MKMRPLVVVLAALVGSGMHARTWAQTQAQIDAANASAQLEALKRESDARAAIAKNAADIANADANARAALTKSQIEAEQARASYYQSLVPDPSNYKVAAPGTPKLNASAAIRAYNEAVRIAVAIGGEVDRVARPGKLEGGKCDRDVWILPGASMAATRTLVAASVSLEKSLEQISSQLESARKDLAEALRPAAPPAADNRLMLSIAAGAAIVQGVLAAATIAKPQFAFETVSQTSTSGSVLEAHVFGSLAAKPCYLVVDSNALLLLAPPSQPPVAGKPVPELAWLSAVRDQVAAARSEVRSALTVAQATGKAAKPGAAAERIAAAAKALGDLANEVDKALATLYVVDAQGNSPIDAAVRGGRLRALLAANADAVYFVSVKTIASDVDLAGKDGLFTRAATSLSSNTIVSWQITSVHGRVMSAGAIDQPTPTEIRNVWP